MIQIPKEKLKFLLMGRQIDLVVLDRGQRWRRDRTYAIGVHHNRQICRVHVVSQARYNDGQAKVAITVRRQAVEDTPRLLGRKHGYVDNPAMALRGRGDAGDPGEAVDERTQSRYADEGRARDRERMAERRRGQRDRIAEQVAEMRADLRESPDRRVAKTVRAIEHQLASLDRTLEEAA